MWQAQEQAGAAALYRGKGDPPQQIHCGQAHDITAANDVVQHLNIQPVIPFSLNSEWNLISRTILPLVYQEEIFSGSGSQSGVSDTLQSFFFSPARPTANGWILGAGPVALLPTGSDDLLTTDRWATGPTAVALRQQGPWTAGALTNHLWHVGGDNSREPINRTFLQPFLSYTTPTAWTYTLQSESTYDWERDECSIPIRFVVSKVTRLGNQLISFGGGIHYWAESTDFGPDGWGARVTITLLFPR